VTEINRADEFNTKFGLRTMKSLRKTVLLVCGILLAVPLIQLLAQAPQQGATPTAPQQNPDAPPQQNRQGKIIIPVNQVVVPVTVKDGSGKLVADCGGTNFESSRITSNRKLFTLAWIPRPSRWSC